MMQDRLPMAGGKTELANSVAHLTDHSLHIALTVFAIVLVGVGAVFLARHLLRDMNATGAFDHIRSPFGRRILRALAPAPSAADAKERDSYIVIPDISGFTCFIKQCDGAADHARYVVSELLDAIVDSAGPALNPSRVTGDSVVFRALTRGEDESEGALGTDVTSSVLSMAAGFYRRREELASEHGSPDQICSNINTLDLKFIVHRGPVAAYVLRRFEDLGGIAVIVAHRLLKNSIGRQRYILVTEAAASSVNFPAIPRSTPIIEHFEDVGDVKCVVYAFDPLQLIDSGSLATGTAVATDNGVSDTGLEASYRETHLLPSRLRRWGCNEFCDLLSAALRPFKQRAA